jgi:toxin ParE1/3/4
MAKIVERPKARKELEDIAVYIGKHRPTAAKRFLAAAQKLYGTLAIMPEIGSLWEPENPYFIGVRYLPIPRYPNYIIFYRPLPDGVESSTFSIEPGILVPSSRSLRSSLGSNVRFTEWRQARIHYEDCLLFFNSAFARSNQISAWSR